MNNINEIIKWLKEYAIAQKEMAQRDTTGAGDWSYSRYSASVCLVESLEQGKPLAVCGYNKIILIFGLQNLPIDKMVSFAKLWAEGGKSRSNYALTHLNGVNGRIGMNAKKTAWVIRIGGFERLHVFEGEWRSVPSQNYTNGGGYFLSLCNKSFASELLLRIANEKKKFSSSKIAKLREIANSLP